MKRLIFITLIAVSLLSTSCQKDGGNADMQTVNFVVQNADWLEYGVKGSPGYGFAVDLSMPEITENVIQNGMVSLYIKSGDFWIAVPVYFYHDSYQGGYYYSMRRGVFSIDYYESDQQTIRPDTQIFRLVIVQPQ
ncbi:MAG: hypothetical protein WCR72_03460 [Bacteroidota bacterium]